MSLQLHEYAWLHILDLLAPLEWTRTYEGKLFFTEKF